MENEPHSLAQFGLDAIDLRWTLKDIAAQRTWMINKQQEAQLIDLGGGQPHTLSSVLRIQPRAETSRQSRAQTPTRRARC